MSNTDFIKFKKLRDLGAILNDTFKFLRTEWQPLFSTIIKASVIPVVLTTLVGVFFTGNTLLVLEAYTESALNGNLSDFFGYENVNSFFLIFIFFSISITFTYAAINVSIFAYIKSYVVGRGLINYNDVKQTIKDKLLSVFFLSIVTGVISLVGYLLFLLPGVYFANVLTMASPILIFQDRGVFQSVGDAFNFIKGHWWNTFGIFLVISIIIGITGWILNLPSEFYVKNNISITLSTDISEIISDPIYLLFVVVSYIFQFLFHVFTSVSTTFIYFDIQEQEYPSTSDIINEIGEE